MNKPYNSFNEYLQKKFGVRVHRLSLDGGFTCPNIDGTKSEDGCIFCDNKAFSAVVGKNIAISDQINHAMEHARVRFKAKKFIAYFQSFSSTNASLQILEEKYKVIKNYPDIVGLSISTRPDCIDQDKLDLIGSFCDKYEVYIEYGLQTSHDKSLKFLNRNHTFSDFKKAVEMTAKNPKIKIASHIILGIPQESKEDMMKTAKVISKLPLWGVKLHCLHIVKNTVLERLYDENKIDVVAEDDYVDMAVSFLEHIPKDWIILRLVSDANPELLIAPLWINDKHRIITRIEDELVRRKSCQGVKYNEASPKASPKGVD